VIQKKSELAKAVLDHMPNALCGGCGWHVVEHGFKRHGPTTTSAVTAVSGKWDKFKLFRKRMKDWLVLFLDDSRWGRIQGGAFWNMESHPVLIHRNDELSSFAGALQFVDCRV
jgi:hypothetical protein